MINANQLDSLHISPVWVDALNATFERFDISSNLRKAAFIGQCAHESGNFKLLSENLNYRAEAYRNSGLKGLTLPKHRLALVIPS